MTGKVFYNKAWILIMIKEVKKEMALLAEQKSKWIILRCKERELEEVYKVLFKENCD